LKKVLKFTLQRMVRFKFTLLKTGGRRRKVPIKIFCDKCGYKFYEGMPRSLYYNNEFTILDHYRALYSNQCPKCGRVFSKQVGFKIKPRG